MSFLYLGQLDQTMSEVGMFVAAGESSGPTSSPNASRSHLLAVTAMIVGGNWQQNLTATITPHIEFNSGFAMIFVAIFLWHHNFAVSLFLAGL